MGSLTATNPRGLTDPSLQVPHHAQSRRWSHPPSHQRVEKSGKQVSLTDGEGRGTGRLVLVLKPTPKRVTAGWMAQQWHDEKRSKAKMQVHLRSGRAGGLLQASDIEE